MAEYTPSEDDARDSYITGMIRDGYGADWGEYREGAGADFDAFLARVRRDAWQEGYDQGAEDGITSEQMQVGIGLGGIARPARTNPYEETP